MTEATAATEEKGAKVKVPPPLIFVFFVLVGAAVHGWVMPLMLILPETFVPGLWLRIGLGVLVFGAGVIGLRTCFAGFKRTGQDVAPWERTPEIIVSGLYRYSRNPMYVGLAVLQVGLGIGLGNLWIVGLVLVPVIAVTFLAVVPEEAYLTEKFGESYVKYKSSVRRWI